MRQKANKVGNEDYQADDVCCGHTRLEQNREGESKLKVDKANVSVCVFVGVLSGLSGA